MLCWYHSLYVSPSVPSGLGSFYLPKETRSSLRAGAVLCSSQHERWCLHSAKYIWGRGKYQAERRGSYPVTPQSSVLDLPEVNPLDTVVSVLWGHSLKTSPRVSLQIPPLQGTISWEAPSHGKRVSDSVVCPDNKGYKDQPRDQLPQELVQEASSSLRAGAKGKACGREGLGQSFWQPFTRAIVTAVDPHFLLLVTFKHSPSCLFTLFQGQCGGGGTGRRTSLPLSRQILFLLIGICMANLG